MIENKLGGYLFLEGIEPYSCGVLAKTGYEVVHVTLKELLPWRDGLDQAKAYLEKLGLTCDGLCGVELRSPEAFSMDGFFEFNKGYRELLENWGLMIDGHNPVARTNVAPSPHGPETVCLHGFSFVAPSANSEDQTFVIAGGGEVRGELLPENIVRRSDTCSAAMTEKANCVMDIMENRLNGLGVNWNQVTTTNVYTVHPLKTILNEILIPRMGSAAMMGVTWHHSRPPIMEIEFEMDLRGVAQEFVI